MLRTIGIMALLLELFALAYDAARGGERQRSRKPAQQQQSSGGATAQDGGSGIPPIRP